jgi:hypothetical protein
MWRRGDDVAGEDGFGDVCCSFEDAQLEMVLAAFARGEMLQGASLAFRGAAQRGAVAGLESEHEVVGAGHLPLRELRQSCCIVAEGYSQFGVGVVIDEDDGHPAC